jgi:hypothetical protein
MYEKTRPVKGGSGEGLKPTGPRLNAVSEALHRTWRPHGPANHHLASLLAETGLLKHVDYGGYAATEAGKVWLSAHALPLTYADLPRSSVIHFRYYTKDDRPDLAKLARCNNINGPICPSGCLTSIEAKVTCKRCLRIMADKPVGTRL